MRSLASIVVLAALVSAPALANPTTAPETTMARASDGAQDETLGTVTGEKVICRVDKEIGSRVRAKRICMTSKQWAERNAEQRQYIEQRQGQRTYTDNN